MMEMIVNPTSRTLLICSAVLLLVLVTGCSQTVTVTYYSEPTGAMISSRDGSDLYGISPARISYTRARRFLNNECLQTPGVEAHWVSGAKARSSSIVELCGRSEEYAIEVERPRDAPGFDEDMRFALEAQKSFAASKQANAAVAQAFAEQEQAAAQTSIAIMYGLGR